MLTSTGEADKDLTYKDFHFGGVHHIMNRFPFSIFQQLRVCLLLLVLCAMAPVVLFAVRDGLHQRQENERAVKKEALWACRIMARQQEDQINSCRRILTFLAALPDVRERREPQCGQILKFVAGLDSFFYTVGLVDKEGELLSSAAPTAKVNVKDRYYFTKAMQSRSFAVGEYVVSRTTGKHSVHYAQPVLENGEPKKLLFAAYDLDQFNTIPEIAKLPVNATILVMDHNGTVIFSNPDGNITKGKPVDASLWNAMKTREGKEDAFVLSGADGKENIYAFQRICVANPEGDLFIAVGMPLQTAFSEAYSQLLRHLAILTLVSLLALFAAWLIGNFLILRNAQAIARAAGNLASGDLSVRLPTHSSGGEFGLIAQAFNEMADALSLRERELRESGETLLLNEQRLTAQLKLTQMKGASLQEITDFALEEAVHLTRSEIGYLAFMNEDESVLTMHSWSRTAMDECAIRDKPIEYPVEQTGLWGEAVRQRKPIVTNDYPAPNPLKKGYPEGHVRVMRHMNIPIFDGEKIVAVAGVGNKEQPYDESDIRQLTLLMQGMWQLVQRQRGETELLKHRDHLEELVGERAAELKNANEMLTIEVLGRRRALEELRKAEDKYRALLQSTEQGIYGVDAEGRCVFMNQAGLEMLGYQLEDVLGKDTHDLFHHSRANGIHYPLSECPIQIAMNRGEACRSSEDIFWRRDGTPVPVEFSCNPLVESSGIRMGAVIVFNDITERLATQNQLKSTAEALERSNKDLEQFAYVASHDLQEPLRMISSYVQLLARRYGGKLDAEADKFIGYAVDGAKRMQVLISDLLAYSRVGSKSKVFDAVELDQVLDHTLHNLQIALQESGVALTRDPLPRVLGDSVQLGQLFQNLIGNALKFRAGHPLQIHVGAQSRENEWALSVRDNGIGIDPRYFDRIFTIFQRLHSREKYPGTGIGLAVCKRIVERHGGRIWVESVEGEGSTFYFTIPKAKEEGK